jgi:hypothetical protein
MNNRKATFAKRQRELDQAERARAREARRSTRGAAAKDGAGAKGPQIDWGEGVNLGEADALPDGVVVPPPRDEPGAPRPVTSGDGDADADGAGEPEQP